MPDYVRDLQEYIGRAGASRLKQDFLIRRLDKFRRVAKREGARIDDQLKFCEVIAGGDKEARREWMFKLCVSRLSRGDFSDWTGWEYRNNWALGSYSPEIPNKRWRLEPVKTLAVLGEQGIGDEIMYGSCLWDVPAKVVFECDPRLVDVFAREGIETRPRQDITNRGDPVVKYLTAPRSEDAFIPVGDLPRLFRKDIKQFPRKAFLRALPEYVEKWKHLKGRVGIAWRSRTGQVKPKDFGIENPVALQYDAWDYELEGMTVPECDLKDGIEDVLGIVANLDRVVTVPQTIVHLTGAIGASVDVVLPPVGSSRVEDQMRWRYIDPMPWYEHVRVYRNLNEYRRGRPRSVA